MLLIPSCIVRSHPMLRAIATLAAICTASAAAVFTQAVPMTSSVSGACLAVFAFAATLLIGSVEAFETQAVRIERDDR